MASCKVKIKGKKSELFDDIYNRQGYSTALKNWAQTQTPEFDAWYGEGKRDANGEPVLTKENEFVNDTGEARALSIATLSDVANPTIEDTISQIERLTDVFQSVAGLDIEVNFDGDMAELGSVITVNGKTKFEFNPRKLGADTVFHEFGHVYIDMIGYDSDVVQRGIDHLRGTELWKRLERLYNPAQTEKFEKEVLTTAIGIEAAKQFNYAKRLQVQRGKDTLGKIKAWKFWVNHFFKVLAQKLGIGQNEVKRLAYDLTAGKLRYTLTGKPVSYKQEQKQISINELRRMGREDVALTEDETEYEIEGDPNRRVARATTAIERIKGEFDRKGAIQNVIRSQAPHNIQFTNPQQISEFWADKREEGTGIHEIFENYINALADEKTPEEAIQFVMDNLFRPETPGELDKEGVRFYSGMREDIVKGYVTNLTAWVDKLLAKGYKLYPEVKVFDEAMGVAGTIDLLVEREDGTLMIYDFKTKERGKFDNFYTYSTREGQTHFLGLADDIRRSKANEYALQLSTYKLILERKGFKVGKLAIVPVVGTPTEIEGEWFYSDVEIEVSDDTKQDPDGDGVLPIADLTEKMKLIYEVVEDVEDIIEGAEETEKTLDQMLAEVSELHKTNEWINNVIVELQRSISRVKATAEVDDAIKFERIVKDMVEKLRVEDEWKAITAYTKYVTNGLAGIAAKFGDRVVKRKGEDGETVHELVRGYDSWTWQKIKEVEETDPKGYMNFIAFMINADMFLEQVVKIRELPSTDARKANVAIRAMKAHEGTISDLQLKIDRLNKELDMRYVELSSNPLYGGRGVLENSHEFFKAQMDESFMQRTFDAMKDTHNSYMANVIRMYDYKMRKIQDETNDEIAKWEKEVKKLRDAGSSVDRFIDKSTGKVIPKTNYSGYYEARSKMFAEANRKFRSKTGKASKKWRKYVNTWFAENSVELTDQQKKDLDKRMKNELGLKGFKKWKAKQQYKDHMGKTKLRKSGAYFMPSDAWQHPTYKSYTQAELDFHEYLNTTLQYMVEHMKDSIVKSGYIPSIPKNDKHLIKQLVEKLGWRDKGIYNPEDGVIVNEAGEIVHFLPFYYNNLLNQAKYEKLSDANDEKTKEEIRKRNREKYQANKDAHAAAVNMNLAETMPMFIRSSLRHKGKKAMEFEMLRVKKSFIKNHKIAVHKSGKPVIDKFKKMAGLENNTVEASTVGSNVLKHYEDWLRMVFYEEFELDEGAWQKVARVLQNYTSFKGMALNPLSTINNQTYGTIMSHIEAAAGEHFTAADWAKAGITYGKGIPAYFARRSESSIHTNKTAAFIDYFNITQDFTETATEDGDGASVATRALKGVSWAFSKAYALEHASEHNLQNRVLIAMSTSHRVVDGQIMSFKEYKRGKMKEVNYKTQTKEEAKAAIAENKEILKKLKEEWKELTTVFDAFELKEGRLAVKEGVNLKENEIGEFERKALGVNQYLHGIYNKEDAGTIQQYALGRLALQFRKWMRSGWNRRWGTRFGKKFWNETRSTYDQGTYVTTLKFLGSPIFDAITAYRESQEDAKNDPEGGTNAMTVMQALGNIFRDYGRFATNIRVHWHTLNDAEKANVIRTFLEYLALCSAIGALYLLKHIKGDDDEPPLPMMLALYQLDRTATELTTYVPLAATPGYVGGGVLNETKKILKSPTATFNTMESAIKIGKYILTYPFADDEDLYHKSGVYHGQNKLATEVTKGIPVYNQIKRVTNLVRNYKYYKLF